jgi:hypothetical protein
MPEMKKTPPPLTDSEIREALRLQSATIRAVTEVLRHKGLLHTDDMVRIKQLRDTLASQVRMEEEPPHLATPGKPN